jgi:hypothetical protein
MSGLLIVEDELANLSASLPDRQSDDAIARALGLLLTEGCAVGVWPRAIDGETGR